MGTTTAVIIDPLEQQQKQQLNDDFESYSMIKDHHHHHPDSKMPGSPGKAAAGGGPAKKVSFALGKSSKANGNNMHQQRSNRMCQVSQSEESLTQFQLDKLAELRKALGDKLLARTPIFSDTYSLLRWLIGWNYKIEEIVPRFEKASNIFRCMNLSELVIEDIDDLNTFVSGLTSAADYFPGGVVGYDSEGNVIALECMGRSCPKVLSKCGRVSDVFRLTIAETALIYQLVKIQELKRRKKCGLIVIIDMEGFNTDHLMTSGLKVYGSLLRMMQILFPDLLRQVFIINAPLLVSTAYNVIKTVLSEQSREKVVFLNNAFKETLVAQIGAENLYPRWGGTKKSTRGSKETGLLRMGGCPPSSLKYSAKLSPYHVEDKDLKKVNVKAGYKREVEVNAKAGDQIHWFLLTNSDIDFGIFTEDDQDVWPLFRLSTDYVPEYGSVRCPHDGTFKLVFDNSFSNFFSKDVRYSVRVKSAAEEN